MASGTVEIQAFIEWHHKRCVAALQRIALLADTGSDVHKEAYQDQYAIGSRPPAWQIINDMRSAANDVVGNLPLRDAAEPVRQAATSPTASQIDSACFAFRCDFDLMDEASKRDHRNAAIAWFHAWQHEAIEREGKA